MNRKCPARKYRNTTVQLSTPSPTHSATMHSVIDRQTDRRQYRANSRSYCVQQCDRLETTQRHPVRCWECSVRNVFNLGLNAFTHRLLSRTVHGRLLESDIVQCLGLYCSLKWNNHTRSGKSLSPISIRRTCCEPAANTHELVANLAANPGSQLGSRQVRLMEIGP